MPGAILCPNSRWRVVHNAYICSHPADDCDHPGVARKGDTLVGHYVWHGWLKLSPPESVGWMKISHAPIGELLRRESDDPAAGSDAEGGTVTLAALLGGDSHLAPLPQWAEHELSETLLSAEQQSARAPLGRRLSLRAKRFVLLQPTLGLCNRLRAIASALILCRATGRTLLLQWYPDPSACGACYDDLFAGCDEVVCWPLGAPPPRGTRTLNVHSERWRDGPTREAIMREAAAQAPEAPSVLEALWVATPSQRPSKELCSELLGSRCLFVWSCADFFPTDGLEDGRGNAARPVTREAINVRSAALGTLTVDDRVRRQLESVVAALTSSAAALSSGISTPPDAASTPPDAADAPPDAAAAPPDAAAAPPSHLIGVHIRRGDNSLAIDSSPVELFVSFMDNALRVNSSTCFYVATDDDSIETMLRARYGPQRISTQGLSAARRADRATPDGIRCALVDLLALARCDVVVGTYYSSFSTLAATWHGVPLHVLRRRGHSGAGQALSGVLPPTPPSRRAGQ